MSVSVKGILGGVSLLGGGCAVATPLALGASSSEYSFGPTIALTQCEGGVSSQDLKEVNYGDLTLQSVCGKNTEDSGTQTDSTKNEKYTTLFKNNGGQYSQNWEIMAETINGKDKCENTDSSSTGWLIQNEGNGASGQGKQYLGLCDEKPGNSTIFIKKQEEHQSVGNTNSKLSFLTCVSDCGEGPVNSSGLYTLTKEKTGSGKEVKFYDKQTN